MDHSKLFHVHVQNYEDKATSIVNQQTVNINLKVKTTFALSLKFILIKPTSPSWAVDFPDQNKCEHVATPRHWSGFFRSLAAAEAQCVISGSQLSSPKHVICSIVPMINVMAANWALESLISSSYSENACKIARIYSCKEMILTLLLLKS